MSSIKAILKILMETIKFFIKVHIFIIKSVFTMLHQLYKKLVDRLYFSITFKITTVFTFIFILFLLFLSISITSGFIAYMGKTAKDDLHKNFQVVSSYIKDPFGLPKEDMDRFAKLKKINIFILDENQMLVYTTEKDPKSMVFFDVNKTENIIHIDTNTMLFIDNHPSESKHGNRISDYLDRYRFILVLNEKLDRGSNRIYIQITNELSKELLTVEMLILFLLGINVIFIMLIILIGSRTSKRMLKPVERMTTTVKNITINDLDRRLDIGGSQDELKELAKTFNEMLDRIQQSYELQNQFVSDASHELRTPIAVIQGYANLLDRWGKNDQTVLEESITSIKTEAENMKDLIEKLLFLARGDKNTQKIERENFNLDGLITEVIKETRLISNGHIVTSEKNENIMIYGDRKLIKEALRIFMDNSLKYTPEGGRINIDCCIKKSHAVITIEDTGIGISKEDLPHIFNRFYRADKSRTKETGGTGLGLAIAKWIVQKHKGIIEVESKLHEGTKITLLLPVKS